MPRPLAKPAASPAPATRFVCVHGHFYQPPRENPWLETVELQESAAPFHDWNERITSECYAPNGASRITNQAAQITRIMNNYARMSFNFGPTLLSWLEEKARRTYRMILAADAASVRRYTGHGSALAQVYNHIIMPLASDRDARTQIRWGIADFQFRFGRMPEGIWLAETAADTRTLQLLAEEGIKFTVLAPHQCRHVRRSVQGTIASGHPDPVADTWQETPDSSVDTTHPYTVPLPNGLSIAVFFYNGPTSRAIAFEGLLNGGEVFGQRLINSLPANLPEGEPAMLAHVATDGESYGHHHKHGEMALSYAMHWIEENNHAQLTNYGEFLERFPSRWEAEINDNTSWSCSHGIERWRSDCGCNGGKPGWNQRWRAPLREALDLLRDETAPLSEACAAPLLTDLWAARDSYIHVLLNRTPETEDAFLQQWTTHPLSPDEQTTVWELMELQRHAQLMYTSCGWFFDDISGIETVQIIAYAGRVLQLARKLFGEAGAALEPRFLALLQQATSNLPDPANGAEVFRRHATGMRVELEQVGAHYAISSFFRSYAEEHTLFCYTVTRLEHEVLNSGRGRLAIGRAQLRSDITGESEQIAYAVLHLGDQNLSAAVRRFPHPTGTGSSADLDAFRRFATDVRQAIRHADLPEVIRLIDRFFGGTHFSLNSLFADEQQRILGIILNQTLSEMEQSLHTIYEDHASLLHFLTASGIAVPPPLALAAGYALNTKLRNALAAEDFDPSAVTALLAQAVADRVELNTAELSFVIDERIRRAMIELDEAALDLDPALPPTNPDNRIQPALESALTIANTLRTLPFEVNLWQAQNIWNDLLHRNATSPWTPRERESFRTLGQALNIATAELVVEDGVSIF